MLYSSVPGGSAVPYDLGQVSCSMPPFLHLCNNLTPIIRPSLTKLATGLVSSTPSKVAALALVTPSMTHLLRPLPPSAVPLAVTPALAVVSTPSVCLRLLFLRVYMLMVIARCYRQLHGLLR
jgi:hypothetical protein